MFSPVTAFVGAVRVEFTQDLLTDLAAWDDEMAEGSAGVVEIHPGSDLAVRGLEITDHRTTARKRLPRSP